METNDLCHISETGNWSKITSLSGGFSLRLVASGGLIVSLLSNYSYFPCKPLGMLSSVCFFASHHHISHPCVVPRAPWQALTYHPRTTLRKNEHIPKSFGISFFNIVHSYILFRQRIPGRQEAHGQKVSFYL